MPKVLSKRTPKWTFKTGDWVYIDCYQESCEHVRVFVRLGQEEYVEPAAQASFTGAGRFRFPAGTPYKVFRIDRDATEDDLRHCPNCKTLFGGVVVVNGGEIAFGYESDPG